MAFTDSAGGGADDIGPNVDGTAQGPPSGPGPGAQGGPPGGGGPILASLARRMRGPQTSAPGPGDQASSMTMVMNAIGMLNQAIAGLNPATPIYQDVLKAAQRLSKHVPQSTPTSGVQATQLQDLLRNVVRNALLQRIMGQQSQKGGGQGGPNPDQPAGPSPLPGAAAQAPMPSTPLPGA